MRKLFISAGHSNKRGKDQGAQVGNLSEGVLAEQTRQMLVKAIEARGGSAIIDDPSLVTVETVKAWRNKIGPNDIVLDLHFNAAGNRDVEGVECIVPRVPSKLELEIADKISDIISAIAETPERGRISHYDGVKYETETARKQLAWMTLPGATVLIEWQFITNRIAFERFMQKLPKICDRIAEYLVSLINVN